MPNCITIPHPKPNPKANLKANLKPNLKPYPESNPKPDVKPKFQLNTQDRAAARSRLFLNDASRITLQRSVLQKFCK